MIGRGVFGRGRRSIDRPHGRSGDPSARRGVVIFAVLIVVVLSALIGWTMLARADAQMASLSASMKHAQARAAAWSGIQAVMERLAEQRGALLGGATPELDEEVEVFAEAGARGVARLVGRAEPEAARLNVNSASVEMLVASRAMDRPRAEALAASAAGVPFGSAEDVPELVRKGFSPRAARENQETGRALGAAPSTAAEVEPSTAQGVGEVLWTAVSADPNLQAGVLGTAGNARPVQHGGDPRININRAWSDELGTALTDRLGPAIAQALKTTVGGGRKFSGMGEVVASLRGVGVGTAEWGPVLDVLTTTDDEFLIGRIDLTTAPACVLACVPGVHAAAAEALVRTREGLDAAALRNLAWPVVEGVLSPEQFERAVDTLTTRCVQWRVRIEAGVERTASERTGPAAGAAFGSESPPGGREGGRWGSTPRVGLAGAEPALEGRVVFEVVVDLASARPRLALLRNVTLEGPVRAWNAARARGSGDGGGEGERGDLGSEIGATDDTSTGPGDSAAMVESAVRGLGDGQRNNGQPEVDRPGAERSNEAAANAREASEAVVGPGGGNEVGAKGGVDRRVGRWRSIPGVTTRPAR